MKRRTLAIAAAAAWIALLVAVAPAAAASTGLVLSLIRQELVRYGLLNADGTPAVTPTVSGFTVQTVATTATLTLPTDGSVLLVTDDNTDNGNVSTPTLPTAVAGSVVYFWCSLVDANDGMVITAASGDTITDLGTSGTAGTLKATVSNSAAILVALDSTRWVLISGNGGWTTSAP